MSMARIITTRSMKRRYRRTLIREYSRRTGGFIGFDIFEEPIVLPAERARAADAYYQKVYGFEDSLCRTMEAIRAGS